MGLYKHVINIATVTTGVLLALTLFSGLLFSSPLASADNSATNNIQITVPVSCNLSSSTTTNHTATVDAGTYRNNIGESTITATCNDSGGFAIYAIGYTGEDYGDNTLKHTTDNTLSIASGTATSGATSNWAMKLTAVTGTYEPTIETTFQGYTTIPTTYTKVASHDSVTDQTNGASFKSTYAAYIAPTQTAGTYEGKVKYTLVHPTNHAAPIIPAYLDTGQNVNAKMKSLASGETKAYNSQDNLIKSIQTASSLPANFEATEANTISLQNSQHPVYIFFDNTNDAGIMYVYSGDATPVLNPDSSFMFYHLKNLSTAPAISSWDTSSVTDMSEMFDYAGHSATTWSIGDLSSWDTSNVTNMSCMFYSAGYSASSFSLDLSSWDTSSVTDMNSMFYDAGGDVSTFSLDLSDWDTSSVTDMNGMFAYAGYSATSWSIGDLSNWDTSSVTDMNSMFYYVGYSATSWSIGDLSNWDTSSVTDMTNMFYFAGYSATTFSLDLSDWDTSSVTSMDEMFFGAGYSATAFSLDLSSWDTLSVTDMSSMFRNAGYSATSWSVTIPQTNGNNISNTTSRMYGKTTSVYGTPLTGKSFTLAQ